MEIRTIIEKQQQHFSLGSFLTIPHFLDIFKNVVFRPNPLLPLIFWSKQTFSLTEKCTINIKFLTSPFCSLLTLSTLLLQISEQHQIVTKTNKDVSLKCFSHTALKYSTSCSNYCCLKPGGWKIHSCSVNGFLQTKNSKFIFAFLILLECLKRKLGRTWERRYPQTLQVPTYR